MRTKPALFLALVPAILCGQQFRSTIGGRVVDPQQAAVPGVRVAAVQVDTGARTETAADEAGLYTLPFLLPGTYRITVEAQGFKRWVREGVVIGANERKGVDIQLEIGQMAETVTVTGEVPLLETATASLGQVVASGQVENLPVSGRTPLMLAQLAGGVISISAPEFNRPFDNGRVSDLSIGGAPSRTNELLMDGSPNATRNGRSAYSPPMDSVLELKVETFQSDAAFGNTGGGTVNLVTKAGTNEFHGSAYNFNQVSALAATPFFANAGGQKKPVTRYNQYGLTLGGPVVLPKLYNGSNRLFFFFAYEGIKQPNPVPNNTTVPTAEMRRGDFGPLAAISPDYRIYDPLTGVREGNRVRRSPFPNNALPQSRLNPIALKYLEYFPLPNQPGRIDGRNNYLGTVERNENFYNYVGRLDMTSSERHKFFVNFRTNERFNINDKLFDNIATGKNLMRRNWGATLDDVYTLTPTLLLNTRASWTRFTTSNTRLSTGYDFTALGFPAALAAASPQKVVPRVEVSPFPNLGDDGGDLNPFDSFQVFTSVNKFTGRHSLKMGADLRLFRDSNIALGYSSGRYQFNANWTRGPLDNSPAAPLGQEVAALLLGLPTSGAFDINATRTSQSGYYAFFLQDDFRVRPSLVLNLGIRYEREMPVTERYNRVVNGFDFDTPNSISEAAKRAYARSPIPEVPAAQFDPRGGLVYASPGNRKIFATPARNFSPRFGFAWTPAALGGKTVLRGGVGIFYFDWGIPGVNQTGFSQGTVLVPTLDGFLTPRVSLSNPFPEGIDQPTGSALGVNTNLGRGVSFFTTKPDAPYSLRYNFTVQRLLARNMVVEVGYLANKGYNLEVDRPLDFTPAQYLSTAPVRDQAAIDRLTALVANPFAGLLPGTTLNGSTVARSTLLDRFPQYTNVSQNSMTEGGSTMHSMNARLDKRFSNGLQLLANYQYSKLLERRSRRNDADPFLEKLPAVEDRPMRFVASSSYALPFGKGKRFGDAAPGWVNHVIGGWSGAGIYTWQSGQALDWGNVIYYGGDIRLNPRGVDGAFDTTRFNTNPREQLGSNLRAFSSRFGNLRADSINNFDLSAIKDFRLYERFRLQYRCEFFNAFNRANFNGPSVNPTSTNFGRITGQANQPRSLQMALRLLW